MSGGHLGGSFSAVDAGAVSLDGFEVQVVATGDSGRSLRAAIRRVGEDLVVVIGGGERPHVGCVVIAAPVRDTDTGRARTPSVSVLTLPPHREEPIARAVAERLACALDVVVVATAGVHDDGLDRAGVATYLALAEELAGACLDACRRPG